MRRRRRRWRGGNIRIQELSNYRLLVAQKKSSEKTATRDKKKIRATFLMNEWASRNQIRWTSTGAYGERERRRLTVTSSISIWIINSFLLSFNSTISNSKETDWHIIYWKGTSAPSNASNGGLKRILIHIVKARICNSSLGWQLSTRFSVREISTGFPFESSLVVMSFIETSKNQIIDKTT